MVKLLLISFDFSFPLIMGKKVFRSHASIIALPDDDFIDQKIMSYDETCSFDNEDIESLKSNGDFPFDATFKSFDALDQLDFISPTWIFFLEYPFSLGLMYPFSGIISKFFKVTQFSYIQAMVGIWMILFWIDHLNHAIDLDIGLSNLCHVYDLQPSEILISCLKLKPTSHILS